MHPNGTEDYDLLCETGQGSITFDIQESHDFFKYHDLRIDYISVFRPPTFKTRSIKDFENALKSGRVTVNKWGKVVSPKADFLLVEFHNDDTHWGIYNLRQLHELLPELKNTGFFRTNHKHGENWGSAFLAIKENHQILQRARPKTLIDILKQAK